MAKEKDEHQAEKLKGDDRSVIVELIAELSAVFWEKKALADG